MTNKMDIIEKYIKSVPENELETLLLQRKVLIRNEDIELTQETYDENPVAKTTTVRRVYKTKSTNKKFTVVQNYSTYFNDRVFYGTSADLDGRNAKGLSINFTIMIFLIYEYLHGDLEWRPRQIFPEDLVIF